MTKSNNTQITDILNNIYNLIVNPETTENERELLVKFKNEIEVGKKNNDELLAELCRAIQVLAVRNLSKGKSLSSGVSDLSKTLTCLLYTSSEEKMAIFNQALFSRSDWFCLTCHDD